MNVATARPDLSVGIVLVPDFTMLALSAFVDTLRLAADEGDRSRPIRCAWRVMTEAGRPVTASNGIRIDPTGGFVDPAGFNYLVVVGGTLHRGPVVGDETERYLHRAAAAGVPLVGLCTGAFILARAGLMAGRRACVSWFHKAELEAEFPRLSVVADALYVFDRDRITCAGGTSVIHLASHLVDRHLGQRQSAKGLRVMLEDRPRAGASPQPPPAIEALDTVADHRVRRAMLLIERQQGRPISSAAIARGVGISERQLNRLFAREAGLSMRGFAHRLRLARAQELVRTGSTSMTEIASLCGFADASHFTRAYRRRYGCAPTAGRSESAAH